jgi:hypothetical protein
MKGKPGRDLPPGETPPPYFVIGIGSQGVHGRYAPDTGTQGAQGEPGAQGAQGEPRTQGPTHSASEPAL